MARIPQDQLDRLKRDTDLVALARSRGVPLESKGSDFLGLCPFHEETEPSFRINPAKNLFHCFGCDAKGSVIDFIMRLNGVSFRHAVEILRKDLPGAPSPSTPTNTKPTPALITPEAGDDDLRLQVADHYHQTLLESPEATAYLEKRGLDPAALVEPFHLGFSNRTLGYHIPPSRYKDGRAIRQRLSELGIIKTTGHELLRGSLVVPLYDLEGRVVQMYGRKITPSLRKGTPLHLYLPGPNRGLFNPAAFKSSEELILCESLIDALSFVSAGYTNTIAAYGTNGFTEQLHEAVLDAGITRLLIAYDRDDAGDKAAEALAERLAGEGITSFRVLFPHHMDANEYARKVQPAKHSLGLVLRGAQHIAGPLKTLSLIDAPAEPSPEKATKSRHITEAEPLLPLAAAPEPQGDVKTQEIPASPSFPPPPPASPIPPPPAGDVPTEIREHEIVITLGDRRWRIRGLARNLSYEQLRINLLVAFGEHFHVDSLDLYSSRQRGSFLKQAATELQLKQEILAKDLGRVLVKLEEIQEERINRRLQPEDTSVKLTEDEKKAALELLKDPGLLDRVTKDLSACGLVGEQTNKLVAYLATVSRKLTKPLGVIIQSSSAAGKSALMDAVLSFVPPEDRVQYSAMTGQSLFYMGETDLKHKVLAIAEEEGAERASYPLKLLQSEGELTIASTGKDPKTGRLNTHEYHVEGPTAILLTTTAIDLDEELLNRLVVLAVDESREQTEAIHRMQREDRTFEGLKRRLRRGAQRKLHQNAQRLLRPLDVVNPYSPMLTFLSSTTRTRRDHMKYHGLIEAVALVHQQQRELKNGVIEGKRVDYIEVEISDIAIANRLASEVLGRTLDELPPQTKRLLFLIDEMVTAECQEKKMEKKHYHFTRRRVREHTGWGDTQLKIHLHRLEEMECLLVHSGGQGRRLVYELLYDGEGKDGEPFVLGLINTEELKGLDSSIYDGDRSGSESRRSGQKPKRSAPGRPQVGGMSGGCRDGENPTPTDVFPRNPGKSPKNAHLEAKEEALVVVGAGSYLKAE